MADLARVQSAGGRSASAFATTPRSRRDIVVFATILIFLIAYPFIDQALGFRLMGALLPIGIYALLAMGLPLNVGGWGPREGVTAWAFGAAGLGAGRGLAVAVVYGVLSLVASLPGAAVLVARWYTGLRTGSRSTASPGARKGAYPRPSPSAVPAVSAVPPSEVNREKYAPKESARLASSSFPFSAEPSEGRPMTPESV